jgi:hypothetical protein
MWLFPLPAVIGIIIWLFILFTSPWVYIAAAGGIILAGIVVYYMVFMLPGKLKPLRQKSI